MNALEQAKQNIKIAQQEAHILEMLQEELPYEVKRLFISGKSRWVTLEETTLEDAIKKMKSLNPIPMGQFRNGTTLSINAERRKENRGQDMHFEGYDFTPYKLPYTLKIKPSHGFGGDTYELYGFIEVAYVIFKITIPVTLPERRLSTFTHRGSTSRSAVVKTSVVPAYAPFNSSFVWGGGGVSEGELFSL